MPLFPREPTLQRRGLYDYDLDAMAQAQAGGVQRDRAMQSVPMFGSGGLQGSGLQHQDAISAAYVARAQEIQRRRQMMEQQRLTQAANIGAQRRAEAINLGAKNIRNVAGGISGMASRAVRQGTEGSAGFSDPYWFMGDK